MRKNKRERWQPITTAPTDGREIIVLGPAGMEIVSWGNWRAGSYDYFSHWMPLPEPPTEGDDAMRQQIDIKLEGVWVWVAVMVLVAFGVAIYMFNPHL